MTYRIVRLNGDLINNLNQQDFDAIMSHLNLPPTSIPYMRETLGLMHYMMKEEFFLNMVMKSINNYIYKLFIFLYIQSFVS